MSLFLFVLALASIGLDAGFYVHASGETTCSMEWHIQNDDFAYPYADVFAFGLYSSSGTALASIWCVLLSLRDIEILSVDVLEESEPSVRIASAVVLLFAGLFGCIATSFCWTFSTTRSVSACATFNRLAIGSASAHLAAALIAFVLLLSLYRWTPPVVWVREGISEGVRAAREALCVRLPAGWMRLTEWLGDRWGDVTSRIDGWKRRFDAWRRE